MRRLLTSLLAFSALQASALEEPVPLKPFRQPAPVVVRNVYIVEEGDTLSSIARRFGRDAKLIQWLNRLENADTLPVGKALFIGDAPMVSR